MTEPHATMNPRVLTSRPLERLAVFLRKASAVVTIGAVAAGSVTVSVLLLRSESRTPTEPLEGDKGETAHLWVDMNGGTCTRSSSPAAYSDGAACSTFGAAWDIASSGDTIRVRAGTYPAQTISGNKTSETTISGEDGVTLGALNAEGNFLTVKNVTVDVGSARAVGLGVSGDNVTLEDVNVHGSFAAAHISGDNWTWAGGEFGIAGQTGGPRNFCTGDVEPLTISGAAGPTIVGVSFHPQATIRDSACNHLEYIRIDNGGSRFALRSSTFDSGDGSNTSTIFVTNPSEGSTYRGFTVENTFFGSNASSSGWLNVHGNVETCANFTIAYSTLNGPGTLQCSTLSNVRWIGNVGWWASFSPCNGTHTRNVWQDSDSFRCGRDTVVIGARFGTDALGLGSDGLHLQARSPAVDAAETTSRSNYCTGTLGSVDYDGGPRPVGAACDAGADERD